MSEEVREMGSPSARMTKISEGGRVWVTRKYPKSGIVKLQGHIDMHLYVNDQIRTEKNTFAAFEFWTGGEIGLNKNTEVEIVKVNKAEQINAPFNIERSLGIDKFGKQTDPLQIRTSSGLLGGLKG